MKDLQQQLSRDGYPGWPWLDSLVTAEPKRDPNSWSYSESVVYIYTHRDEVMAVPAWSNPDFSGADDFPRYRVATYFYIRDCLYAGESPDVLLALLRKMAECDRQQCLTKPSHHWLGVSTVNEPFLPR
jgi:hypothetical protein